MKGREGFGWFLTTERRWTEGMSTKVRGLEERGVGVIEHFTSSENCDENITDDKQTSLAADLILHRLPSSKCSPRHFAYSSRIDPFLRHGLVPQPLPPQASFDDHSAASYAGNLEKEREREKERRANLKKKKEEEEDMLKKVMAERKEKEKESEIGVRESEEVDEEEEEEEEEEEDEDEEEEEEEEEDKDWGKITEEDLETPVKAALADTTDDDGYDWARNFLWKSDTRTSSKSKGKGKNSTDENLLIGCQVDVIKVTGNSPNSFLMLTSYNLLVLRKKSSDGALAEVEETHPNPDPNSDNNIDCYALSDIVEILPRSYLLKSQGLEFFFGDGRSLLVAFLVDDGQSFNLEKRNNSSPLHGPRVREIFWQVLRKRYYSRTETLREKKQSQISSKNYSHHDDDDDSYNNVVMSKIQLGLSHPLSKLQSPRTLFLKSSATELWRRRKITNYEYIMRVNMLAGRSFNDLTQNPVFPWVLSDYESETINLSDERVYRELSKPVGALNENRLKQLLDR